MSDNRDQTIEKEEEIKFELEPLMNARTQLVFNQQRNFFLSGLAYILIFIPILVILLIEDDECDKPIREWLITLACVSGFYILTGLAEATGDYCTKAGNLLIVPLGLLSVFQLVWYIIGSVWLFDDPSGCKDDWSGGYTLTLILLILFYIEIGIIMMVLCCCCCCIGLIAGAAASAEPNQTS
jgi:hypothetical protein